MYFTHVEAFALGTLYLSILCTVHVCFPHPGGWQPTQLLHHSALVTTLSVSYLRAQPLPQAWAIHSIKTHLFPGEGPCTMTRRNVTTVTINYCTEVLYCDHTLNQVAADHNAPRTISIVPRYSIHVMLSRLSSKQANII